MKPVPFLLLCSLAMTPAVCAQEPTVCNQSMDTLLRTQAQLVQELTTANLLVPTPLPAKATPAETIAQTLDDLATQIRVMGNTLEVSENRKRGLESTIGRLLEQIRKMGLKPAALPPMATPKD